VFSVAEPIGELPPKQRADSAGLGGFIIDASDLPAFAQLDQIGLGQPCQERPDLTLLGD